MKKALLPILLAACCAVTLSLPGQAAASSSLEAGAAAVDITPKQLPVLVNGGMTSRSLSTVKTRLHARAVVARAGEERLAIVVVDSCMMGRAFLDETKAQAFRRTGIPSERLLICATHAHSAPASMGCLGTDADPAYVPQLREAIVEAIATALAHAEPARVGFARADAGAFTALRQWIRRPDRIAEDPFGNKTVRANMHAGRVWDDVTGEAGPKDPDLTLLSFQALDGRPICVLGNFSMHYFGDSDLSADYFGLFSEGLKNRIAPETPAGKPPFVGMLSHGCSGDIYRVDYTIPEKDRPKPTIGEYTEGLLDIATKALASTHHADAGSIAMTEKRIPLSYRVPDKQRLEWARRVLDAMGDRPVKTQTEVYAREQILLHEAQKTEVVVQALRIGDLAIATTPCETYAVTGLKIKAASPLPSAMVIELANGGDGYIPPPEQHAFGGYNTWPARSAGLEVQAEPKIAQAAIELLEKVAGRPRRPWKLSDGPAANAVLNLRPAAYWRLNEFNAPHAADASPNHRDATYEPAITYHLEGPHSAAFCSASEKNRAPHFVGGRLRARFPELGEAYSVSAWIWNGMPNEGRAVSGWIVSRDADHGLSVHGEHLGIGGSAGHTGRLMYQPGSDTPSVAGRTEIPRWEWQHVALVRERARVRAFLNGKLEFDASASSPALRIEEFFFGGRSDNDSNWEGRMDEVAVFPRALSAEEVRTLAMPRP